MSFPSFLINLVRGFLIGAVEIIPGVSGGTVALIIGVYEDLIKGASHLLKGMVAGVLGVARREARPRARQHFAQVRWAVVAPVLIGAAVALFTVSTAVNDLIKDYPVEAKALFFGLIAASVVVPLRMAGGPLRARDIGLIALAIVVGVGLTSLPVNEVAQPPSWLVMVSAAFAVCALVLPGVSGAFLLVAVGMYDPTLNALVRRDWAYLAVFVAGAVIGLALFVQLLQWLLEHRRRPTLMVMTGLMVGSLRALWPWQGEGRALLPAGENALLVLGLALAGAAVVTALIALERRLVAGRQR